MAETLLVAVIVQAHGVRGQVRVKSFTQDPEALCALGPLSDDTGTRRFTLSFKGRAKELVLCAIDGVTDRTAAEALKGTRLFVDRQALDDAALEEDEYYHADLLGLAAETPQGRPLGRVRAVHDFGAGDVLEILAEGSGRPVVVPFTRAVVPRIDLAAGRLVVDPPPGLLDDGREPNRDQPQDGEDGP